MMRRSAMAALVFALLAMPALAQEKVTGTVVDADGTPLVGVQVMLGKQGKTTRGGGRFSFTSPPGRYMLTVKSGRNEQPFNGVQIQGGKMTPENFQVDWVGK